LLGASRKLKVWAFAEPVDMRKSYNGLSAIVRDGFKRELLDGDVFVFVGKTRKRAKALFWDGTGVCIYQKRMEQGRFAKLWRDDPNAKRDDITLTMSELALFFEGSEHVGRKSLSPDVFVLEQDGQVMFAAPRREHPPGT
jgi:transposase